MKHKFLSFAIMACLGFLSLSAAGKSQEPETYNYKRGLEAVQDQDYDQALNYFSKEVKENPKNGYAHFWMAIISIYQEDLGDGLSSINQAIKYLPKDEKERLTQAYGSRAQVYLTMKDTVSALNDYAEMTRVDEYSTTPYFERANVYFDMKKYDLATADYNKILSIDDGEQMAYIGLARNLSAQKKYQEAVKVLERAKILDPAEGKVYTYRAEAYIGLKNWPKATDDIITGLRLEEKTIAQHMYLKDPEGVRLLLLKLDILMAKEPNVVKWPVFAAMVAQNANHYQKAIDYYNEVHRMEPEVNFDENIAQCYSNMGNNELALQHIDKALENDSTVLGSLSSKALYLYQAHRNDEALACASKLIEKLPANPMGYYTRATFNRHLGNYKDAIEDFTMAITLDPETAEFYVGRGVCYDNTGNKQLATQDYQTAVKVGKDQEGQRSTLSQAYFYMGDNAKAIELNDSCLAHDPTDGDYYNSACLYSLMGNTDKALDELQIAFDKGFAHLGHMENDRDMDNVRALPRYKAMVEKKRDEISRRSDDDEEVRAFGSIDNHVSEIPFTKEGGVYKVKCSINDLPLSFIFDTGAASVSLSQVEATFMMKNGYLTAKDVVGSSAFSDANGDVSIGTIINLKKVKFGDCVLENVKAGVVGNQRAPLLLGQSVLSRLGKIEIDYSRNVIIIKQ
ncbi:MAG: tetratricopeptide repeat protein [Muribaculaceae bacterium]|nr:tetratricopeptide repeat protein [Muribaculaceae bacterium]